MACLFLNFFFWCCIAAIGEVCGEERNWGTMLTGGQFYDVLCAVVPLYVALFLGYGSLKWWGVVTPEQSVGINRFNALLCMPLLIFEIIAFSDLYTMNHGLIAAYCLSNSVVLGGTRINSHRLLPMSWNGDLSLQFR